MARASMRILFLTRYQQRAASSRLRCYDYLDILQRAGISVEVSPLLNDVMSERFVAGNRSISSRLLGPILAVYVPCCAPGFTMFSGSKKGAALTAGLVRNGPVQDLRGEGCPRLRRRHLSCLRR